LRVARLANLRSGQNSKPPRNVTPEDLEKHGRSQDITRQISRRWKAGDVYAPKDLSDVEMAKWKKRSKPERDVFDVLGFDPVANYKNFSVMSEYMTPMGRIKHGKETGLRSVNQRKIAKAIRRVIGLGMMPSVHRHPELLHKSAARSDPTTASRKLY
jgi:small subunit ribosomal protein S18